MIAPLLLATVLAADVERVELPPEPRLRTVNVYTAPLLTVGAAAAGGFVYGSPVIYLPVGATFAVGDSWGITAEVAGSIADLRGTTGWSLGASIGPTWLPSQRGVEGWFVTPKLSFQIASMPDAFCVSCPIPAPGNHGPIDLGAGISRAFLFGVDAGYQFSASPVSVGLVVGAGVGYQWDGNSLVSPIASTSTDFEGRPLARRPQGFAFGLNFSVVRVGVSR